MLQLSLVVLIIIVKNNSFSILLPRWSFHCENLFSLLSSLIEGDDLKLEYVRISRLDEEEDVYIDQLLFLLTPLIQSHLTGRNSLFNIARDLQKEVLLNV